jgi:mono/diheme cytochrome c family protein
MKGIATGVAPLGGVVCAALLAAGVWAQAPQTPPLPPVLLESLAGSDSFARYCAPCHGESGRGDGPVAAALKEPPADLTSLARRNDGRFPRDRVRAYVAGSGRPVPAHGSSEMPVWGPLFSTFESDARTKARLENLVDYIERMQPPSTAANDPGALLFRTYCGSCHGANGRGDGPAAAAMREPPPDLTHFAQRNGDLFPSERVYRIIDGRDVPAHGDRDMPVWGDAFRASRGGMSDRAADARIQAIVRFLEAIQERATQ